MEDMTAVQLIVCVFSAYRTHCIDKLKIGIQIYFDMVECGVSRVYSVLHDLGKRIVGHSLYIFYHSVHRNMLGNP